MDENNVLQWDVLQGTYKLHGDVALCEWDRHLHRKLNYTSGQLDDSCWEEKDARASLKWQQIRLPGNADDAKFRALIADAAAETGTGTDLAQADWFHQHASARCREWPAASFGDGLIESYTPYWHSISRMSSESAPVSAQALHRLITEEEMVTAQDCKHQASESGDPLWKGAMKPLRLDAFWEDGYAHPAMDAVKAVGMWRKLDRASTLRMLEKGLESHRAVDVEDCRLLGVPILCTGGVVKDGEAPRAATKAGGAWIETRGCSAVGSRVTLRRALIGEAQGARPRKVPFCHGRWERGRKRKEEGFGQGRQDRR
eukprot:TRINITY_DN6154_c0_g1_i1.p1 TRINITY_DN6154_c0_g1~~TRINITY_DN6154_c0_g1_i1.p1  ORF type:complete len:314 (-),score=49.72 TRINITY_DN6154_c0_g1_i1:314-1255(-)